MKQLDLATLHEAIAEALCDEPCIIADRTLTWAEVTDRTRRLAAVLRGSGLGHARPSPDTPPWETGQDHLGILLHNGPEYLEALLGAHKASVAPFNINYRYTADELEYLLRDATPAALVYGGAFAELVGEVTGRLPWMPMLLQVGGELIPGARDYEATLAAADPTNGVPDASADDRYLLYTGGTTGMPKGVIWRVGDMLAGPAGVRRRDGQPIDDLAVAVERALAIRGRTLPAPPLMHGAGTGIALGGWFGGATVVIQPDPDRFDAATLLDTVESERITTLMIVGDAFGAPIVEELRAQERDLSSLRLIVNSGAALRDELKEQLRALVPGLRITDMLGSSETGINARRGEGSRYDGRGVVTVISDDRTRVLQPGSSEIGWLATGGNIPIGYLGDADKTRATFITVDGRRFSVPGDRARLAADGFIEFLGRDSTIINTGGEKVFADEVEGVVRSLPGVADAIVVGRASERWGQEVVALVALSDDVEDDDLTQGVRAKLAGYKVPKAFIRVDAIHRHANGKPDYTWAKEAASA
jgi:acyl-CoA synthetase (AMP-forming)/AMP-acid ligase II